MIVASLLLILVAVTLLVLGLVGGSSSLLTSSIVASMLAAVALVIGARQAAAARRAGPAPAGDAVRPGRRPADLPLAGDEAYDEPDAYAAGSQDADEHLTGPDATQRVHPDADLYDDDAAAGRTSSGQAAGPASPGSASPGSASAGSASGAEADFDDDQAATVIGGARAADPDDQSWRRETVSEPVASAGPAAAAAAADDEPVEFDEPDPDDPDDEPLPQAVRPADAVRVARLDAEVLVVDGRPRYHLADCPHLVGRLTEGLPVAEAVELGFSPCGLCRPVDRLVAAAARH
jgi:hypothetical protein